MTAQITSRLYVIDLEYICPLDEIDRHLPDHVAFLKKNYQAGHFLVSGPKHPRTGGMILAKADDKEQLEAAVKEDPFVIHGLARISITEFEPRMKSNEVKAAGI